MVLTGVLLALAYYLYFTRGRANRWNAVILLAATLLVLGNLAVALGVIKVG